ncbi:MAB_1171c family putative transporter [Streptomyces lonegramiae]|uniref:MAB_1171c family putative transporter n=1 Tax=Streptomyces lonegramiae TaxID=3075524 RepID=A0ABU2XAB0_9ACTN|nr:MAB_1171c family putative transporter [Streptomyces sp. DSM 41529]MDT0542855.1 MAB_1171c family putative transporter [Streptomyces sp. DSM 41529]
MSDPGDIHTLGYFAVGAVIYGLAAYKALAWAVERIPSLLLMAVGALFAGTGFLAAAPTVYRRIGEASGVPQLATLVVYTGITACCGCILVLALLWSPRRLAAGGGGQPATGTGMRDALRRVLPGYGTAIAVMTALFLSADLPPGERPLTFDTTFADRPPVLAFLLVYQAAFGVALWSMVSVCCRRLKDVHDPILRSSLRLLVIGCVCVGSYGVCKVLAIFGAVLGSDTLDTLSTDVGPALASLGGVITSAGWTRAAVRARRRRRRDFYALETLWTTVTQADPGVILHGPPSGSAWEFHALRRTHEIRDGQLALRPWTSQHIVNATRRLTEKHGLAARDRDALAAAAGIRGALEALRSGRPPRQPCERLPGTDVPPQGERGHLVAVARQLDSPLIDRILAEAEK